VLQSWFSSTVTGFAGLQAGNGNETPQASAMSSTSGTQLAEQLGWLSALRSPRIGVVKVSVQLGCAPACVIIEQSGEHFEV